MIKKKEKLEQMRELGRGGLSKGIQLLRAAAANASFENGDATSAEGPSVASTNRMTYEELVALSMKLTRQNKLMKAQYQKNQSKLIDAQALQQFLEAEVGLDVAACIRGDENSTSGGTIDMTALTEKYRVLIELQSKEQQQAKSMAVESVNLLDLSPVLAEKKKYDEIDLLQNDEKGGFPVDEALLQVDRMRDQLREGSRQTEELVRRMKERDEQFEEAKRVFKDEKETLESEWQRKWSSLVDEMKGKEEKMRESEDKWNKVQQELEKVKSEVEKKEEKTLELEQEKKMLMEQLEVVASALTLEEKVALEAQVAELEAVKTDLQMRLDAVQAAPVVTVDDKEKELAFETNQRALKEAIEEKTKLQEQLEKLSSDQEMEQLQAELEAAKKENVRLDEQLQALKQVETTFNSEEAIASLRQEVERLQSLVDESDEAKLHQEVVKESAQDSLESATLLQELERVKGEAAEYLHKLQQLKNEWKSMEERLLKTSEEKDATLSLVEALKQDKTRLADQVNQLEHKQTSAEQEIVALTQAKRAVEEQFQEADEVKRKLEKQVEEERTYWTSKLENLITESDVATTKAETLQAELQEKEVQLTKMTTAQTSLTSEVLDLQKQMSGMRQDLAMAAEGLERHANKAEENEKRYLENERQVITLKKELDKMREMHHANFEMLRKEKEAELERVHTERRTLMTEKKELVVEVDELEARCSTLQHELNSAQKHEQELETSLNEQLFQVKELSVDLAETKKSLSDRMALATRLQTENMGMAGKLAEQVALIESALREASNSKTAQHEMEIQVQAVKAEAHRMKENEDKAKRDLEIVQQEKLELLEQFQQERDNAKQALQTAVENEKHTFQRQLDRLESESKHKSKLALQAVLEKETELTRLRTRLEELEEDVRSGGADHRKIIEFAQLQAKREADQRDQALQLEVMSQQLEQAAREIQQLQEEKRQHAEEVTAMLQNQRRDGVNMEYLKNVVVQYMSFRPGSSQQARLVPVLSTLLQFTASDVHEIEVAARRGSSWKWGTSEAGPDYKPIRVRARSSLPSPGNERVSVSVPRVSNSQLSRTSSFFLPDEPAEASAESADF